MILKVVPTKGDKALYLMKSVKRKGDRYPRKETVEFFGYLSELEKVYDDPIAHFKEVARQRTEAYKAQKAEGRNIAISVDLTERFRFDCDADPGKAQGSFIWMGQMPLLRIYHELEVDEFLAKRKKSWGIEKGMEVIYKLLVIGRTVVPSSKYATWNELEHFRLGNIKPSDDDVYNALDFIGRSSRDMLRHLNEVVCRKYGRNSSLMYYDVTNYYFELDDPDNVVDGGLRVRGVSKEHRPEPIVQMGLFMDADGIPVTFGLFPGNNNDVTTFIPMIDDTRDAFGLGKMIYIADKGMMSYDNIAHIVMNGCGFIISDSPRKKQPKDLIDFLLDEEGYSTSPDGAFRIKSRTVPVHKGGVTYRGDEDKKTCTVDYNEVQIVFWSRKYAQRAKAQRLEAIEKARRDPKVFDNYHAKGYFDKIPVAPGSGEVLEGLEYVVELNEEKLGEAEKLDGYYILRTNVIGTIDGEKEWEGEYRFRKDGFFQLNRHVSDQDIVDMYRGLWEIEENFKLTKSYLSTRPVYVRKESSIRAHFMTCFMALLMVRLLERRTSHALNHSEIVKALQSAMAAEVDDGVYRNMVSSKAMDVMGKALGLDLTKAWYTAKEMRSLAAKPRKPEKSLDGTTKR